MHFSAGQTVVHPHHGPATVTGVVDRTFRGTTHHYIQLKVHRSDLELAIPVEQAESVGLRRISSHAQLDEILAVLNAPTSDEEEMWSRRMKANGEKLRIGELKSTAEVVRDLTRRQADKGISAGEKDMLKNASHPILAELALSLSLSDDEAAELLERAITGPAPVVAADVVPSDATRYANLVAAS